jgi:CRP/FNR family transcriptional regulator
MDGLSSLPPTRSTRRSIKKRTILLYQGEIPRQAYVVQKGTVKVYRLGRNGDEQIVGFRMAGDIFPETWLFEKTTSALYYYEAMDDCEIITAERSVLLEHINKDPQLKESLLDYFINSHSAQLLQITALEQSRAADKLLLMLYYLLFRYSKQTSPGNYELKFHLTHTIMGNLTGLTRETTSVELGKLRRKEVVTYSGNQFVIHREKLELHLAKESFNDVQI